MVRLIGFALLLIAIVTLVVWGISQFVQPVLPAGINSGLVLLVAALIGVVGFFSAFKDSIELLQMVTQPRDQRFLNESLDRTAFDKATIERATQCYIWPKCSNIDPAQEQEMRHALVATREDLFAKVDYFLDEDQIHRHLLILADSGTGKTSFVLNYYAHNARRPVRKRHKLVIVPLGIRDADEILKGIPQPDETAVFLDALDEDTKAIKDHRERVRELMGLCGRFKRVVITCRTQFFPKDEEIPVETGTVRIGPRKAGEKGAYDFVKLYLSPFDDQDVKRYLWRSYPFWAWYERQKAYDLALKIPLLSVRPMLLAHIPDIVAAGVEIMHSYQLYEAMVDAWLERESSWANKEALRQFSEYLAVNLYLKREDRGMERVPHRELGPLAQTWGIPLDTWQISSRSLLNRDAEGNYKFAHRSVMEYLFILQLKHENKQCVRAELTDQMKRFLMEMLMGGSPVFPRVLLALLPLDWTVESTTGTPADMLALQGQLVFFMETLEMLGFNRSNPQSLEQALPHIEARQRAELKRGQAELQSQQMELERQRVELERQRAELEKGLANPERQRADWTRQLAKLESQLAELRRGQAEFESQLEYPKRALAKLESQLAELKRGQAKLGRRQANPERQWAELESQRAELEEGLANPERTLAKLARQRAEWARQLAESEKQQVELARQLAELERWLANPERRRADWERRRAELERQQAELERPRAELKRWLADLEKRWANWEKWSQICLHRKEPFSIRVWPFSFQGPEEGVVVFLEQTSDQAITQLFVVSFDETTELETSAWSVSVSSTQLDALKRQMNLSDDERFFRGLDSARMWRLALHFYSHGLSVAQMRSIQTRVRFEATSLESPKYIMRFIA
jgi:hypothetical protein